MIYLLKKHPERRLISWEETGGKRQERIWSNNMITQVFSPKRKRLRKIFPWWNLRLKKVIRNQLSGGNQDHFLLGYKEIKALRVMIQSYTQHPSFGDVKTFQEELDSAILKVQKLEADLHSLNLALKELEYQLEEKQCIQKPVLLTPSPSHRLSVNSTEGSLASSAGYGTINSYSSSEGCDDGGIDGSDGGSDDGSYGGSNDGSDDGSDGMDGGSDGGNDIISIDIVYALYNYDGKCGESSIAMIAGELFTRVGEDEDGWTKVRRRKNTGQRWQGFVPTSYLAVVEI